MHLKEAYGISRLWKIYRLYSRAFPASEKKPFLLMLQKRRKGGTEILFIEDSGGEFLGLAIVIRYKDRALLDYFAVLPEKRDGGVGTKAFGLLKDRYREKRFFLEIENTGKDVPDAGLRARRKDFYLRNGMTALPMLVDLFGEEMEILAASCSLTFEEYHEIYEKEYGRRFADRIRRLG